MITPFILNELYIEGMLGAFHFRISN